MRAWARVCVRVCVCVCVWDDGKARAGRDILRNGYDWENCR